MPVFLLVAFTVNVARKSLSCAIENNGDWLFKIKRKHRNFKHLRTVKNSTIHSRPQKKILFGELQFNQFCLCTLVTGDKGNAASVYKLN